MTDTQKAKAQYRWHEVGALLAQGKVIQSNNTQYRMRDGKLESKYLPVSNGNWKEAHSGLPTDGRLWEVVEPGYVQVTFEQFARWAFKNPDATYRIKKNVAAQNTSVSWRLHTITSKLIEGPSVRTIRFSECGLDDRYFIPEHGQKA